MDMVLRTDDSANTWAMHIVCVCITRVGGGEALFFFAPSEIKCHLGDTLGLLKDQVDALLATPRYITYKIIISCGSSKYWMAMFMSTYFFPRSFD